MNMSYEAPGNIVLVCPLFRCEEIFTDATDDVCSSLFLGEFLGILGFFNVFEYQILKSP